MNIALIRRNLLEFNILLYTSIISLNPRAVFFKPRLWMVRLQLTLFHVEVHSVLSPRLFTDRQLGLIVRRLDGESFRYTWQLRIDQQPLGKSKSRITDNITLMFKQLNRVVSAAPTLILVKHAFNKKGQWVKKNCFWLTHISTATNGYIA